MPTEVLNRIAPHKHAGTFLGGYSLTPGIFSYIMFILTLFFVEIGVLLIVIIIFKQ